MEKKLIFRILMAVSAIVLIVGVTKNFIYDIAFLPQDCPKGHLDKIDSCQGESWAGWQNSGQYYFVVKGKPSEQVCSIFAHNKDELQKGETEDCSVENKRGWRRLECRDYVGKDSWQCYECDEVPTNLNNHYYKMIAFSGDCKEGIYFSTTNDFSINDFIDKLKFK